MLRLLLAAFALACAATAALTEDFSRDELANRAIERRSVEAVIWGMPAVNYDLMRQEMLAKTSGKENAVLYWSRPLDWKNQTLTPNPDSIYLMVFWNTKDAGPVVIEIPPGNGGSLAGNIVDVWQMPLEDVGPAGADQGKGGKYLILPPGYSEKPPQGCIPLRSDTYGGYALLRSNLVSHGDADIAKPVAYGKSIKVYPLSKAANPLPTVFTDAEGVVFDSTIRYDPSFFRNLDRIVQSEPWLERDKAMIDQLKSIGIQKGKPFNPDAKVQALLDEGAREAHAWLEHKYDLGFPPFWPASRWGSPAYPDLVKAMQSGYADPNAYSVDERGVSYSFAFIGIKRLGTAQFYLITIKDKDGQDFDGGQTYRLTVPADAPVKQYWSATAYDRETHALIRNIPRASRPSQIAELPKERERVCRPLLRLKGAEQQSIELGPTHPDRKFGVLFRLYGPEMPLFDKTWRLPDIERINP